MPAPLTPLDDATPLDGDRVDAAVRAAWLLRTARLAGPDRLSQAAVGTALREQGVRTHARLMSEVENGKVRHGRIVDGYERALGLPEGHLRAPIDVLYRSSPGAPADRDPATRGDAGTPLSVQAVSDLGDRLRSPARRGGDWLAWSRALGEPDARGFPSWLMRDWLRQLVDELGRSVGSAYTTRLQSVAQLRTGPYASLVLEAAREAVATPHAQVVLDVVTAVADFSDDRVLEWAVDLLADPRPMALRAAGALLRQAPAAAACPPERWEVVVDAMASAVGRAAREPQEAGRLAPLLELLRDLPPSVRQRVLALAPTTGPVPAPEVTALGAPVLSNPRWRVVTTLAERAGEDTPDRSVLARLLFELLWDPRQVRHLPAALVLRASPLAGPVRTAVLDWLVREARPSERGTCWRLAQLGPPLPDADLTGLFAMGPDGVACGAVMLAHAGQRVGSDVLDDLLEHPEHRRRALYVAGLTEDPWLDKVATDLGQPEAVRGAARWWQERRGLIDDTH